ncbi:uncharacterized protein LOC143624437 [Bidens hawaiensis]|uniref:uncharacterized protein LOC143624437 n=1 Tax=Bidens hawaiensis TaxID=980011 RepID=UPI00404A8F7A
MDNETSKKKHKLHCYNFLLDSAYTSDLVAAYYYKHIYKEPCMISSQTGQAWIMEALNGNPIRCVNAFRMHPNVFMKLCRELESKYGLQSSDKMLTFEKVGIFLYTLALGLSNRDVGMHFQRSGETISRTFHEVLEAITSRDKGFQGLARDIIRPKDPTFQFVPPQILNDTRYMPYFKKRFKILGTMPKYSVQTKIDVIMATFALHNYIRNSQEDIMFTTMEQHPNYIPREELDDVSNHDTNTSGLFEGTTNEMKYVRNNIATLIWNTGH